MAWTQFQRHNYDHGELASYRNTVLKSAGIETAKTTHKIALKRFESASSKPCFIGSRKPVAPVLPACLAKEPKVVIAKSEPKPKAAKAPKAAKVEPVMQTDGVWVLHKAFGRGMIVSVIEGKTTVSFADHGIKVIAAAFSHLLTKE